MEGAGVIPGSSLFLIMETLKQKVKEGKVQIKIDLGFCPNSGYRNKKSIRVPDLTKENFRELLCSSTGLKEGTTNQWLAKTLIANYRDYITKGVKRLMIAKAPALIIKGETISIEAVGNKRFIRGLVSLSERKSVLFFFYWTGYRWEYYIPVEGNWINPETKLLYGYKFESDYQELERQGLSQIEECSSNSDIRFLTGNYPHKHMTEEFLDAMDNSQFLDYEKIHTK